MMLLIGLKFFWMVIVGLGVVLGASRRCLLTHSGANNSPMKIGIIGSGNIGSTLGIVVG